MNEPSILTPAALPALGESLLRGAGKSRLDQRLLRPAPRWPCTFPASGAGAGRCAGGGDQFGCFRAKAQGRWPADSAGSGAGGVGGVAWLCGACCGLRRGHTGGVHPAPASAGSLQGSGLRAAPRQTDLPQRWPESLRWPGGVPAAGRRAIDNRIDPPGFRHSRPTFTEGEAMPTATQPRLERNLFYQASDWEAIVAALTGRRLLVVGDVMLDEYVAGDARRVCPEAPVPVVEAAKRWATPGGAANAAANAAALGGRARLGGADRRRPRSSGTGARGWFGRLGSILRDCCRCGGHRRPRSCGCWHGVSR